MQVDASVGSVGEVQQQLVDFKVRLSSFTTHIAIYILSFVIQRTQTHIFRFTRCFILRSLNTAC